METQIQVKYREQHHHASNHHNDWLFVLFACFIWPFFVETCKNHLWDKVGMSKSCVQNWIGRPVPKNLTYVCQDLLYYFSQPVAAPRVGKGPGGMSPPHIGLPPNLGWNQEKWAFFSVQSGQKWLTFEGLVPLPSLKNFLPAFAPRWCGTWRHRDFELQCKSDLGFKF